MNIQRIQAIFEKDMKDVFKNTMLLLMPLIPIVLAIIYHRLGEEEGLPLPMLYLIVGVTFSSVTSNFIMVMIAEENEKNTLRGLIMSPASFADIIIGKSLVTGLMSVITLVVSLLILDIEPFLNIRAMIGLILMFLFFLLLGIAIGLFSKTVSSTSAYMMPVMFLFGFTPMVDFLGLGEDSIIVKITNTFPIPQSIKMHETNTWSPLAVVFIWFLAAAIVTYICFKKRSQDE